MHINILTINLIELPHVTGTFSSDLTIATAHKINNRNVFILL